MRKILLTFCLSFIAAAPALAQEKQYSVHAPNVAIKSGGQATATVTIKAGAGFQRRVRVWAAGRQTVLEWP